MAKEDLQRLREQLADAKSELRKFKKENKIRKPEQIEDPDVQAEFDTLQEVVDELQTQVDATLEEVKSEKGSSAGGGAKYGYPQVTDPATGEKRDLTKEEKKRWRTHARKAAKKLGVGPEEVPFDENFFLPKVKVEKKAKEKKAKDADPEDAATDPEIETPGDDIAEDKPKKGKKGKVKPPREEDED